MAREHRTLLFIEDDPDHQMLVRLSLAQHNHYTVVYADDGAKGVAKALELQPDIMMPELDGLSVLEKLREHPSTRDIPAVVLSAKALPEDIQAGLDRGARAYFVKPFDVLRLEERLDDILDGRDTGEPVPD
ncbi:MAG: response regulator [Candidatus Poribacteria bacterium]